MTETPEALRRRTMQAVKSKDTKPEWTVRRLLHAVGYRYRRHVKTLPGKPDLVFPGRRAVVFVHGCFWHGHDCGRGNRANQETRRSRSLKLTFDAMFICGDGGLRYQKDRNDINGLYRTGLHLSH